MQQTFSRSACLHFCLKSILHVTAGIIFQIYKFDFITACLYCTVTYDSPEHTKCMLLNNVHKSFQDLTISLYLHLLSLLPWTSIIKEPILLYVCTFLLFLEFPYLYSFFFYMANFTHSLKLISFPAQPPKSSFLPYPREVLLNCPVNISVIGSNIL